MKRSFLTFSALFLVVSVFGGNAMATTPIAVDMYQDMESGNAGDVLTSSIMNASCHGGQGWTPYSGTMWVSTAYHRDLPGPVICGGVTYNGTGGSRSWKFSNNLCHEFDVKWADCGGTEVSEACYYTTGTTLTYQVGYDTSATCGAAQLSVHANAGSEMARLTFICTAVVRPDLARMTIRSWTPITSRKNILDLHKLRWLRPHRRC